MYWNSQVTSLTVRLYETPNGYDQREPYVAVAQVELFSTGTAFVHAILKKDETQISFSQWCALAALLSEKYNVKVIKSERNGKEVSFDAVEGAKRFNQSKQENKWQPQHTI